MKSLPSLPWRKVRHQPIGDRIIKLTNRCVWVIDVSNPLGGPQGKCQLINNTLLRTGSSLLQSMSLPSPRGAKPRPKHILFTHHTLKAMEGHCFNIYFTEIFHESTSNSPFCMRKTFMSPYVKKKNKLFLYLLFSDSGPDPLYPRRLEVHKSHAWSCANFCIVF